MTSLQAEKNNPFQYKNPEFTLKVETVGVGANVRLNDISIAFDMFKGSSIVTYDVNESIISGVNELTVITFPFFGATPEEGQTEAYHPESEIIVSLYVNEKEGSGNKKLLSKIHLKPSFSLEQMIVSNDENNYLNAITLNKKEQPLGYPHVTIGQQIIAKQKTLPIQANYPRWEWQDGEKIEDTQENYNSLLSYYREIYNAHKSKNKEKLFSFESRAANEFAIAYHLEGGIEAGHRFIETAEVFNDHDLEMYDFRTDDYLKLDIFADGKMARIIDNAQYHPILYTHKTLDMNLTLKFSFYKNKQNQWVMIR